MPFFVENSEIEENAASIEAATAPVNRGCKLEDTTDILLKDIPAFDISSEIIAYASPDSTYAVTKTLLESAKTSVLIGIYDFTATYVKEILLNLMARGVKVALMLDLDGVAGENKLFSDLAQFGAETVSAPSCANQTVRFFSSSHEKVIVIDDTWVMVQSGNYSNNSIPFNETDGGNPAHFVKGNRDMGVAINSPALAAFFTKVLRGDMKLATAGPESGQSFPPELPMMVEAVPPQLPDKLFKSKRFKPQAAVKVTPVLSPDNYMSVVPGFLASAKKSIYIEQQYIRGTQSDIVKLLQAIKKAVDTHNVEVRIILGKVFGLSDLPKEKANLALLENTYGLKLGEHVRYINTNKFVHCHNKLIVIDNEKVLVSSQNFSNSAVSKNREAGLILEYADLSAYYTEIFQSDWDSAMKTIPPIAGQATIPALEVAGGGFVEVSPGDYADV